MEILTKEKFRKALVNFAEDLKVAGLTLNATPAKYLNSIKNNAIPDRYKSGNVSKIIEDISGKSKADRTAQLLLMRAASNECGKKYKNWSEFTAEAANLFLSQSLIRENIQGIIKNRVKKKNHDTIANKGSHNAVECIRNAAEAFATNDLINAVYWSKDAFILEPGSYTAEKYYYYLLLGGQAESKEKTRALKNLKKFRTGTSSSAKWLIALSEKQSVERFREFEMLLLTDIPEGFEETLCNAYLGDAFQHSATDDYLSIASRIENFLQMKLNATEGLITKEDKTIPYSSKKTFTLRSIYAVLGILEIVTFTRLQDIDGVNRGIDKVEKGLASVINPLVI